MTWKRHRSWRDGLALFPGGRVHGKSSRTRPASRRAAAVTRTGPGAKRLSRRFPGASSDSARPPAHRRPSQLRQNPETVQVVSRRWFALPQGTQMLFHELLAHPLVAGFALRSLQIGIDRSACLGKARGLVIGARQRRPQGRTQRRERPAQRRRWFSCSPPQGDTL